MQHLRQAPIETAYGNLKRHPGSVFVQREYLQSFNDYLLPCLRNRFVLIIGDHDLTTPRQLDMRYPFVNTTSPYWINNSTPTINTFKYRTWSSWLHDSRIYHIFVEHLDELGPSKVSPIPLGLDPKNLPVSFTRSLTLSKILNNTYLPLSDRPLRIRITNRLRHGPQYTPRKEVKNKCTTSWREFCVSYRAPNGEEFFDDLKQYPFVLCVHGGGIDPNPLAWTALLAGTIPIIQKFPGGSIYDDLPVVKISSLSTGAINLELLSKWLHQYEPQFYGNERVKVVEMLMTDFWWSKIQLKVNEIGTRKI